MVSLAGRKTFSVTDLLTLKVLPSKPGMAKFLFGQMFLQIPSLNGDIDIISLEFSVRKTILSYTLLF